MIIWLDFNPTNWKRWKRWRIQKLNDWPDNAKSYINRGREKQTITFTNELESAISKSNQFNMLQSFYMSWSSKPTWILENGEKRRKIETEALMKQYDNKNEKKNKRHQRCNDHCWLKK